MRIQVVFNTTPVLVPCGDGHLTVGELIQKAILRFKRVVDKVKLVFLFMCKLSIVSAVYVCK